MTKFIYICILIIGEILWFTGVILNWNIDKWSNISMIELTWNTSIDIDCIDNFERSGEWEIPMTIYHNSIKLNDFWLLVHYFSPNSCEYDKEYWNFIDNWKLNPQWWPIKDFSERIDFKVFKPCTFTPISIYQYSWNSEWDIEDFVKSKSDNFTKVDFEYFHDWDNFGRDGQFWKKRYFWPHIMSLLEKENITLFRFVNIRGEANMPSEEVIMQYNDTLIDMEVRWEDCAWYPQITYIDVLD